MKNPSFVFRLAIATITAMLFSTAPPIWASTITWINTSGGDWNVAGNWNPEQVPGAADTALINTSGTYIVNVTDTESAASLTIGGATGTQTLQVNSGGVLNESSGTLAATGLLTVEAGGFLNMASTFTVEGPLTNAGTMNLTNAQIYLYNNDSAALAGGIVNQGVINFCGASGDQIFSAYGDAYLVNQGTVNEEGGTGMSSINADVGVLMGTYNAALGTTVKFIGSASAPLTVGTPPVLNGPGQYEFVSGYLLLTVDAIPNLSLMAGQLALGPAFQEGGAITNLTLDGIALEAGAYQINGTLTVTNSTLSAAITVNSGGVLDESGGTLAAIGSLTVEAGGLLNVASSFTVDGPLTNAGTINLTNAQIYLYNNDSASLAGGIVNQGEINFYGASGDQIFSAYGDSYLINQGTVNELGGTGMSSINADIGVLTGTYNAALGTTVQFSGGASALAPLTVGTPPVLNGPGQYEFVSGYLLLTVDAIPNLSLAGGQLALGTNFQAGGAITNLTLDEIALEAAAYQVNGTLTVTNSTLSGAITVNSGGVLDESGGTLAGTGSLTVEAGGLLNVASSFSLDGPLTNAGTINLTNAQIYLYNNDSAALAGGIVNQGEINFYGASGDQIESDYGDTYLINQGTVNELGGTGMSSINADIGVLTGTYNAALGTTVQFSGGASALAPLTVGTPPVLNGPGQYEFVAGYLLLTVDAISNLSLTGGQLALGTAFQEGGAITNLTLGEITLEAGAYQVNGRLAVTNSTLSGAITVNSGGVLDETGGTLVGAGSLAVAAGGLLNVASSFAVEGPLTNAGTINLTNAQIYLYNNGSASLAGGIINQGEINLYGAFGDQIASAYGDAYMINQGTISQRPGTGNSYLYLEVFADPGTVDSQEGTLTLSSLPLQSSSVLNFGLNSSTDYGKIAAPTNVVLNGTVSANLNNGFVPATGDEFNVLSSSLFGGTFANLTFPAGTSGKGVYGSTVFSLLFTGSSTPTNRPVLTIARLNATTVTVSWLIAAGNFNLQTSTTPSSGQWSIVNSGINTVGANYVLTDTDAGEAAFFRLQSQ
jgi:fibronectin-binding autotransporter adhesin